MKKFIKWFIIIVVSLAIIAFAALQIMTYQTKKASPEETVTYNENGYDLSVTYSRPFKKDRVIFGGLVPYGEVWRTGANEATTFITGTDLTIDGKELPAGEYTLWTIPGGKTWEVMFNSGEYGWGIEFSGKSQRKADLDVVNYKVARQTNFKVVEQFTIEIDGNPPILMLGWDSTRIDIPLNKK